MPTYEYECDACDFHFERRQKFHEPPIATCPECQGQVRRVLHPVPVIFKGSGFYITDSRKAGTKEPAKGKKETSGKKKGKGKEGESTPAASH